ncbi:MAG: hypothetical protein ACREP7_00735 [Lysobacter sp.]
MAEKTAINREKVATAPAAGLVVVNRHDWDVEASANNDTVEIGELPAYHRLLPEACSLFANAAAPAMTVDVCVVDDTNKLFAAAAIAGGAFQRVAFSAYALAETIGVAPINRKIFLKLNVAPATSPAGAKLTAQIASYATT